MNYNVLNGSKVIQHQAATVAGTTNITANNGIIDCSTAESVIFVLSVGTLTTSQTTTLKIQGGNAADGSDMADLAASHPGYFADADSGFCMAVEVVRPTFRYLQSVVVRGTANAVVNGVIAIVLNRGRSPIQAGDIDAKTAFQYTIISPAAGTF